MYSPEIDIDLKLKTVWLRNLPLFTSKADDAEALGRYLNDISSKEGVYKYAVDGLTIQFFIDVPITGFVEWAFVDSNLPDEVQYAMVKGAVSLSLDNGLLEMILDMAKKSVEQKNKGETK